MGMTANAQALTLATPAGPFSALLDGDGAVLASGWSAEPAALLALVHPALRPDALSGAGSDGAAAADAVERYLDGELGALDAVAVHQRGAPFTAAAWEALRAVPPGAPVSYARLAALAGCDRSARAAGNACARNAATLFVPCHRAVRSGGAVGGFRWGPAVKRWLLEHERLAAAPG